MYKLKLILSISFLFLIILSSSCILESNKSNSCIYDIDCKESEKCIDNKCQAYVVCTNTSECFDDENCIDNKCKKRICLNDEECGVDEHCDDAKCIYIPKKEIGGNCIDYGNIECESGTCIADQYRFFCTNNCEVNEDCPDYMYCGNFFEDRKSCMYINGDEGDYTGGFGSNCSIHGQSDCMQAYICVENINNRNEDRCLMECKEDYDCYDGYRCSLHEDSNFYCMPPNNKKTGEICNKFNVLECKNIDDTCININQDSEKFCTKKCETDNDCTDQTICKTFGENKYCMNDAVSDLGETCKDSGTEQCKENLICDMSYSRGPVCTKECENDNECSDYSSCDMTYYKEKLCRPAVNGIGNRTGELGTSCFEHGGSDCKDDLLCLSSSMNDKNAFCTYYCEYDEECGENFHCADPTRTGNKICVIGNQGELGSNCYNDICNDDLFCNIQQYDHYTAKCSRLCEVVGEECEKEGYYCNKVYQDVNFCLENKPVIPGDLGEKCPDYQCREGLSCIFDATGNFCSYSCDNELNLCPDNFVCNEYDENNSFCYPIE